MSFKPEMGPRYGADITLEQGSGTSTVVVDGPKEGLDSSAWMSEIDSVTGAVLLPIPDHRIQVQDMGHMGARVFLGEVDNNPIIYAGKHIDIQMGLHIVRILATEKLGINFQEKPIQPLTEELEEKRFPGEFTQ